MADPLSGFPEWLPEQELVQSRIIDLVRSQFELHGFAPLRTRSIEATKDLVGEGGDTDKEIYGIGRLAAKTDGEAARLGLHYDLTVPFARYVGERRNELVFPFRRYQIQQAWRGERPQLGRYREFIQADADVVANGTLDIRFDVEMVRLLRATVDVLPIPPVRLLVNNRKVLEGFYRGSGIENIAGTLRIVDKLAKIGPAKVIDLLVASGLDRKQADGCVEIAKIEVATAAALERDVRALGVGHALLDEGLRELSLVLESCNEVRPEGTVAALHIARGLEYYTGTVIEGMLVDHPTLSSVCSGGRYDNLVGGGSGKPLPGVGVSIGVSRLMGYGIHLGLFRQPRKTPAAVMVIVHSEEQRRAAEAIARTLRSRAIPTLVSDSSAAYGKQIKAATQLGVPYAWFPPAESGGDHEVKDLVAGVQEKANPETWQPSPRMLELMPSAAVT